MAQQIHMTAFTVRPDTENSDAVDFWRKRRQIAKATAELAIQNHCEFQVFASNTIP